MALLFSSLKLGRLTLVNRICVPPMCQYRAIDGLVQPWHTVHYGKLATSGAGLIVLEATAVRPEGRITPWCLGLWNDKQQDALAALLKSCRSVDDTPKFFIQLSHSGRKGDQYQPWHKPQQPVPLDAGGFQTLAPSAQAYSSAYRVPLEMTQKEIFAVIAAFAQAARRAQAAGFDGIQIHAAHGYLIHQFLSPLSNHRTDQWGGSLANRMRFGLEVVKAVREATPELTVMIRVSATDWVKGGWNVPDTVSFVQECGKLGCSAVDVSAGGLDPRQQIPAIGPGYQVKYAATVKHAVHIPTFAVGLIKDPLQAETILAMGDADGISVGREMLRNPNWGWTAAQALHAMVAVPPPYLRAF